MKNLTLITGGARCGKSQLAESLALSKDMPIFYLATMSVLPEDREQIRRVAMHRGRRPASWHTIECAGMLAQAIAEIPGGAAVAIVDCLSLEVTNFMLQNGNSADPYMSEHTVLSAIATILRSIEARPDLDFIVVTNETGWGVVPETALGRAFRDFLGVANQQFASAAEQVYLVCAGLKIRLKPPCCCRQDSAP